MNARIGDLRERVVIQSRSTAAGAVTWSTLATVWAAVRAGSAGESEQAEAVHSSVGYEVEVHYRADVLPTMRLQWTPFSHGSAKTLQINGVRIAPGRPERLLLDCAEVA